MVDTVITQPQCLGVPLASPSLRAPLQTSFGPGRSAVALEVQPLEHSVEQVEVPSRSWRKVPSLTTVPFEPMEAPLLPPAAVAGPVELSSSPLRFQL